MLVLLLLGFFTLKLCKLILCKKILLLKYEALLMSYTFVTALGNPYLLAYFLQLFKKLLLVKSPMTILFLSSSLDILF